ncbi:hypothetical protein PoB_007494700 [Plakobranchus ocellatus]|uniref:G-protein coupled receptors family 1 profile domain-containing protein n=1 Tax=Plakobranchus ocellatus TaxID=259542 RepID=A0AAV4DWP4_9GAST|nr:hypothetical protein PoB_007494700 [Plakobranchus ocellatus]
MSAQAPYENASTSTAADFTDSVTAEVVTPLVDYIVYYFMRLFSGPFLTAVIAVIGIFTNTINIIVYYKMGLQDDNKHQLFLPRHIRFVLCRVSLTDNDHGQFDRQTSIRCWD